MAEGSESSLNFDTANLENSTVTLARKMDVLKDYILPIASVLLLALAIYLTIYLYKRLVRSGVNSNSKFQMENVPPALRASMLPLVIAFALTHAFSAASVYYNTGVANPSTELYFQAMGAGRLFSLTHAHLFAHAAMYFIMAMLVQLTGTSFLFTVFAPIAALWAGVFDVFSWWGLKQVSIHFEWLSISCGSLFSIGFLLMAFAILKSALCRKTAA